MSRKRNENNVKRIALERAVDKLCIDRGLHGWTIKDLAETSDVDLGNIWYYGRLKSDFQQAMVDKCEDNYMSSVSTDELKEMRLYIESELFRRGQ